MRSKFSPLFVTTLALAGFLVPSTLRAEDGPSPAAEPAVAEPPRKAGDAPDSLAVPASNPLSPIIDKMKSTGDRLEQGFLNDKTTEAQQQIVADLEKLLRQSRQKNPSPQPPQSNSSSKPDQNPSGSQSDSPESEGGGASGGQRRQDQKEAAESTERTQGGVPTDVDRKNQRRVLTDAVWGHLPPRVREQLNRSISDRYLPEYEALVKRYYEALATRRHDARSEAAGDERSRGGGRSEAKDGTPSP